MFVRIWHYVVAGPDRERFEAAYGPTGDWARLFAREKGYLDTELLAGPVLSADGVSAYVTLDRWLSESDWFRFQAEHGEDYRRLDLDCEKLTVEEAEIGAFTTLV